MVRRTTRGAEKCRWTAEEREEAALSRVGPLLYEAVFKHYTKKQWDKYQRSWTRSVLLRLPCRATTDDRYFSDPWQALPKRGYTRIFENMLLNDKNIQIRLNCDFFELKKAERALPKHKLVAVYRSNRRVLRVFRDAQVRVQIARV